MTDRPDDQLPEHERRPQTDVGGGITGAGGTAPETRADRRAMDAGLSEEVPEHESDIDDEEPEDPNGPKAAYQPRSI